MARTVENTESVPFWQKPSFTIMAAALIVMLGLVTYSNTFNAPFILDDPDQILHNAGIKKLWPVTVPMGLTKDFPGQLTRPVVYLTLAINYNISEFLDKPSATSRGMDDHNHPPGLFEWNYHVFNMIVHLLAGLTLLGLARRTLLMPAMRARFGTHAPILAAVIALTWMLHPMLTSAVTYIIQRAESLMGLFYLLTLYCGVRAMKSDMPILWIVLAALACIVGMGTKQIMVTAPLMLIAYDWAMLELPKRERVRLMIYFVLVGLSAGLIIGKGMIAKKLLFVFGGMGEAAPLAAGVAVYCLAAVPVLLMAAEMFNVSFTAEFRRRIGLYAACSLAYAVLAMTLTATPMDDTAGFEMTGLTAGQYGLTQLYVHVKYLALAIVPYPLCLDYEIETVKSFGEVWYYGLIVLALLAATVWGLIKRPVLGLAGLWYFMILAPSSSVMPIKDKIFEFRVYVSLVAFVTLVVCAGYAMGGRFLSRLGQTFASGQWRKELVPIVMVPLAAIVLAALPPTGVSDTNTPKEIFDIYAPAPTAATTAATANTGAAAAAASIERQLLFPWSESDGGVPVPAPNVLGPKWDRVGWLLVVGTILAAMVMAPLNLKLQSLLTHWAAFATTLAALACLGLIIAVIWVYNSGPGALLDGGIGDWIPKPIVWVPAMLVVGAIIYLVASLAWQGVAAQMTPQRLGWIAGLGLAAAAVLLLSAVSLLRNHDFRSEEAIWEQTLSLRPRNPRAHSNMGVVKLLAGKTSGGLRELKLSVQCNPWFLDAVYNLGVMAGKMQHPTDALIYYRRVIGYDPKYLGARFNLAVALQDLGRFDDAIVEYKELVKREPRHVGALMNLGVILCHPSQQKYSEGAEFLERAVRQEPLNLQLVQNLSECYKRLGRTEEAGGLWAKAAADYERMLTKDPTNLQLLQSLGECYRRMGRGEDADKMLRQIEDLHRRRGGQRGQPGPGGPRYKY